MKFLHDGLPKLKRSAQWKKPVYNEPEDLKRKESADLKPALLKILSNYNVASKEWIIRQYDHEVQGASVLKPLVGEANDGPGDACIVRPVLNSKKGIIISNGINPRYGLVDPYWMAAGAIDEALRQIISVGGSLKEVAILDNFCWGNTDKPDRLGGLVRAAVACYDIAKGFGVPFISGKDSLNNEYSVDTEAIAIPGTLLISAIGVMEDVSKAVSMDLKEQGNLIFVVGTTYEEMGGSHYYYINGTVGNSVPIVNVKSAKIVMEKLSKAMNSGIVSACHDCSEGGIAVACAEMAFSGGLGMDIRLEKAPFKGPSRRNDTVLFSESNTRFIVEVPRKYKKRFRSAMKGVPIGLIGEVNKDKRFKVTALDSKTIILDAALEELKKAWQGTFKNF
jgi:phosphoribosylformylglycinamidine synthase